MVYFQKMPLLRPTYPTAQVSWSASEYQPPQRSLQRQQPRFVPAGQSTQMIIGATKETDYHIVTVAEALYHNYDLKRVFYSAFVNVNHDEALPGAA